MQHDIWFGLVLVCIHVFSVGLLTIGQFLLFMLMFLIGSYENLVLAVGLGLGIDLGTFVFVSTGDLKYHIYFFIF